MEDLLRGSTAVAPSLQPYVAGAGAVESGLYRFLSPIIIQVTSASSIFHTHALRIGVRGMSGGGRGRG